MSEQWFDGPPPSIGWWPTSIWYSTRSLRWWNGLSWSVSVREDYSAADAGYLAKIPDHSELQVWILWTHRPESWPEWSKT